MYASWEGHGEVVKLILQAGADANAEDKNGETALMYAEKNGHAEIVRLLKEAAPQK